MLGAVNSILGNPRYTGRRVWNRQRTDTELADPANIALGHRTCRGGTCPTAGSSPRPRDLRAAYGISLVQRQAAYRCRHSHTSAARPVPARPKNAYVREDRIRAQLPALHSLLTCPRQPAAAARGRRRTR
jgi:site-specific DNA recombinase